VVVEIETDLFWEFRELEKQEEYDALEHWYPFLNPLVHGLERARKAVVLSLVSGADDSRRKRIHVLLTGEPGTGKSDIRNFLKHEMGAVGVGPSTTDAGLKADARGGITPGALNWADGGVLTIDELDKFSKGDREALLEAMEEGEYEVTKGGDQETFPAETRVVACANRVDKFSPELMDRFDFVIHLDRPSPEQEKKITDHVYRSWFGDGEETESAGYRLKKYVQYCRLYHPQVDRETLSRIIETKNRYIDLTDKEGDVREKETFLRVTEALAKLNRTDVTPQIFVEAIRLVDNDLSSEELKALKMTANGENEG